jgi:hypothetical protein
VVERLVRERLLPHLPEFTLVERGPLDDEAHGPRTQAAFQHREIVDRYEHFIAGVEGGK